MCTASLAASSTARRQAAEQQQQAAMPLVIAKTVLPDAQRFYLALGRIFGIGKAQGLVIAEQVGISKEARVADLKQHHVQQVRLTRHCLTSFSELPFTRLDN